ncbi:MAG: adenylate/guanylate cyclase domain-containing protein [Acidimicrobiia bacterium]|nr:adenylate/guanylate cyclase domain-containing protein [Acidimicrobiia bacterium]
MTATPEKRGWLRRLLAAPRNIAMATWLAVAVLVVTVTSLVVTSILSLTYGQDLANDLSEGELSGRAAVKAEEVARYVEAMRRRTAAIASSAGTADAVGRFADAYAELENLEAAVIDESSEILDSFYREDFAPALEGAIGVSIGWRSLLPATDAGVYLQRHYVAEAEQVGQGLIDDAGDGSAWSEVHRDLHLGLLETSVRLGADDLYLIDPESGAIVYSASKSPDFATSLEVGPHGGSTLGTLMRTVREAPQRGTVTLIDMAPYVADLGSPMLFMASPVFAGDQLRGILALKVPGQPLDDIMTSEGNWRNEGFGETGEVFLVGADGRMRSVARPFVEDPTGLLAGLEAAGTATEAERAAMAGVGTTAMFLKAADTRDLVAAADSSGTKLGNDYLLREVSSAVQQLDLGAFTWYVIAQVEDEELSTPISDFRRALLLAVAVFVIGITFGTVGWARRVFRPVRNLSEKLRHVLDDQSVEGTDSPAPAADGVPTDFTNLANSIDEMLEALGKRKTELETASAERIATLRSLLPPAAAERVESGEREVIDQIPQAGIVVVITDGLGDLVAEQEAGPTQELLSALLHEVDAAAVHHGLERVKLIGDAYYAGCGLSQPYLDHVPRSVAFALDVIEIVNEINLRHATRLRPAVGIDSGPVTVGLTGSMRLVYDIWGEAVRVAYFLARQAHAGEILVTSEVRTLLPPDVAVAAKAGIGQDMAVFAVEGLQIPVEASHE